MKNVFHPISVWFSLQGPFQPFTFILKMEHYLHQSTSKKSTFKMFDNNLTLGKKTNNPPTTEKWTCSFPEKRPIFMIDWLKSVAHWRQNPQMRSNDWFLLFCGWSHYTITKRSYERRSRKGGNELATISQCMKKRPNFIGYLIKLQKWSLFSRTARNAPWFYYTG